MNFFSVIMLLIFWFAWFLILDKRKWDLKGRAEKYKHHAQLFVERGDLFKEFKKYSQKEKEKLIKANFRIALLTLRIL